MSRTERHRGAGARRIVVKIGSAVLAGDDGGLDRARIDALVDEIAAQHGAGREMVVVTSGAVAAGLVRLGLAQRPKLIPQKQAAAAVGQIGLMSAYEASFARHGLTAAQVLLTSDDMSSRRRHLNAEHAFKALLAWRVVPVVNENDTVVVDEIKLGDNDHLSALTALLLEADLLVILSDVGGLYDADPRADPRARLVATVDAVTPAVEAMAGVGGPLGTGGMATKLAAAKKATASGVATIIANGRRDGVIGAVLAGAPDVGTFFRPVGDRLASRKRWIAYTLKPGGSLVVDDGARRAIVEQGRSLLASGLRAVDGAFGVGACVQCKDLAGREFARGLVSYSAAELEKIKGRHSREIEGILGYKMGDEVIHRDDLVRLTKGDPS
ncbi:MAG: glutamate 5-kinase [Deltaproteobacteria bacterium]|nr:glutamate 5-kinase [Deltaproteobacteria bacterium]